MDIKQVRIQKIIWIWHSSIELGVRRTSKYASNGKFTWRYFHRILNPKRTTKAWKNGSCQSLIDLDSMIWSLDCLLCFPNLAQVLDTVKKNSCSVNSPPYYRLTSKWMMNKINSEVRLVRYLPNFQLKVVFLRKFFFSLRCKKFYVFWTQIVLQMNQIQMKFDIKSFIWILIENYASNTRYISSI